MIHGVVIGAATATTPQSKAPPFCVSGAKAGGFVLAKNAAFLGESWVLTLVTAFRRARACWR
jgi:hypothetical protein